MQFNDSLLWTITSVGLRFMMATTLEKNQWSLMPKWSDNSASRKTKARRQHEVVTFATWALEKGWLLLTKKLLNTRTWVLEMRGLLVTVKVLKVQTCIRKKKKKKNLNWTYKNTSFTKVQYLASNDFRYCDISFADDLAVINLPAISWSAKLNIDSVTNPVWRHFSKIVLLQ